MRLVLLSFLCCCTLASAQDQRGRQFIGFERFNQFERELVEGKLVLVSPKIETAIAWDELILSWNFRGKPTSGLETEAKAIYPGRATEWYHLGKWALEPDSLPRESVRGQKDENGRVDTDTLKLKKPARAFQVRLTLRGVDSAEALKFLGISVCDSSQNPAPLPSDKTLRGTALKVPERSQADFPEGISEWCSPTSVSMLLGYWAAKLGRADLKHDVPEVAAGVRDPNWPGTGNWPFNMAFAGSHNGMRAYVTRFSDVAELEEWVKAGVPVAISVRYGLLKGSEQPGNGHLVVCIGFDEDGNVIFNDPGRHQVRQTYRRENVVKAWAESENTVYLVYPEGFAVPPNRFGHWYSEGQ